MLGVIPDGNPGTMPPDLVIAKRISLNIAFFQKFAHESVSGSKGSPIRSDIDGESHGWCNVCDPLEWK